MHINIWYWSVTHTPLTCGSCKTNYCHKKNNPNLDVVNPFNHCGFHIAHPTYWHNYCLICSPNSINRLITGKDPLSIIHHVTCCYIWQMKHIMSYIQADLKWIKSDIIHDLVWYFHYFFLGCTSVQPEACQDNSEWHVLLVQSYKLVAGGFRAPGKLMYWWSPMLSPSKYNNQLNCTWS